MQGVTIPAYLPRDLADELKATAESTGRSVSQVIRERLKLSPDRVKVAEYKAAGQLFEVYASTTLVATDTTADGGTNPYTTRVVENSALTAK